MPATAEPGRMTDASPLAWLGVKRRDTMDELAFAIALQGFAASLERARPTMLARSLVRLDADPLAGTAHAQEMAVGPPPFDAIVEVTERTDLDGDALAEACGSLPAAARDMFDGQRSGVLFGSRHVFVSGNGPISATFWHRPAPGRSIETCQRYWVNEHRRLGERLRPPVRTDFSRGYEQIHADPRVSERIADALGFAQADFTGAVHCPCASPEQYNAILRADYVKTIALPDERNFIDHRRSFMAFYAPRAA